MKKLNKLSNNREQHLLVAKELAKEKKSLQPLLSLGALTKKKLAGVHKRYYKEHLRLLQNQIYEVHKAKRKADEDLSKIIAEFQFKHSKKINDALLSSPNFLQHYIDQHLGGSQEKISIPGLIVDPLDNPKLDEFVMTMKILEKIFDLKPKFVDPYFSVRPHILSCPSPLSAYDTDIYTITGNNFGANPGNIYITIIDSGIRINLTVMHWKDTAIMFKFPANVEMVPFYAEGYLIVENAEGHSGCIRVTVEPRIYFTSVDVKFSDDGFYYNHWRKYEKELTLTSPMLPRFYKLFDAPYLNATSLGLSIYNKTYIYGVENPGTVSLLAGPYFTGNCLEVRVKVSDDWYWDYEVNAFFIIMVPKGYSAPGWG